MSQRHAGPARVEPSINPSPPTRESDHGCLLSMSQGAMNGCRSAGFPVHLAGAPAGNPTDRSRTGRASLALLATGSTFLTTPRTLASRAQHTFRRGDQADRCCLGRAGRCPPPRASRARVWQQKRTSGGPPLKIAGRCLDSTWPVRKLDRAGADEHVRDDGPRSAENFRLDVVCSWRQFDRFGNFQELVADLRLKSFRVFGKARDTCKEHHQHELHSDVGADLVHGPLAKRSLAIFVLHTGYQDTGYQRPLAAVTPSTARLNRLS